MLKYINLVFFLGMVVMNYLANALPINNKTTGELSGSYPNLFVPAGITFSIWGIIYLLLAVFCIIQFLEYYQPVIKIIGWLFAATCILNGLWIVCWHNEKLMLSVLVMLGLLLLLILINLQIRNYSFGIVKASFGIYLGWICIATIANITALLVSLNWNGFGLSEVFWTITMISAGMLITSVIIYLTRNPYPGLAVIWAFAGIIIERHDDLRSVALTALFAAVLITLVTVLGFLRKIQM